MYDNANNDSLWPYFKDDSNFNLKTTNRQDFKKYNEYKSTSRYELSNFDYK